MNRFDQSLARSVRSASLLLAAAGAVGVALMSASSARAAGNPCDPRIPYTMPDLDQVRVGAPNLGTQFCVPTCTMNIFKYLTNHGYPSLDPGAGPWAGAPVFASMTNAINDLAIMMNTDPFGGTGGTNAFNGINDWFDASGVTGDIVVTKKGVTASDAPELGDIALSLLINRPISLSVGWYEPDPVVAGRFTRRGGHCVSATRLPNFCGPNRQISIRDPGNGGTEFSQQPGTTETYDVNTNVVQLMNSGGAQIYAGPLERMQGYGSNSRRGHIDGFRSFAPAFGIAACNNPVNGVCVQVYTPNPSFTTQPVTYALNFPGGSLVDLDVHASNARTFAITEPQGGGPRVLFQQDHAPGSTAVGVPTPFNISRVVTGRSWNVAYVLNANPFSVARIQTGGAGLVIAPQFGTAPWPISAIAFDEANNELIGISTAAGFIIRYDGDTMNTLGIAAIPGGLPIGPSPRITVGEARRVYLASGSPFVQVLEPAGAAWGLASTIPVGAPAQGVQLDDRGRVFTQTAAGVQEFARNAAGGWSIVAAGKFAAMPSTNGLFRIARSRSNLNPAIHDRPEFTINELPTIFAAGVPDCKADFDLNGSVTIDDIFQFLNAWFDGSPLADTDESLSVTIDDIFRFLNLWFRGC